MLHVPWSQQQQIGGVRAVNKHPGNSEPTLRLFLLLDISGVGGLVSPKTKRSKGKGMGFVTMFGKHHQTIRLYIEMQITLVRGPSNSIFSV